MTDETIEIDPDAKTGAPDDVIIESADAGATPQKGAKEVTPEEGIEALKAQLADSKKETDREKQGRIAAEGRAHEAVRGEVSAKTEVHETNLSLITNAIETVKQNSTLLKSAYSAAMQEQNFDEVAELQEKMALNSARLIQLERGKDALESAPKPKVPERVQSDPVETFASSLSAPSGAWVRAHPECVTNPRMNQKMVAAHNLAEADGVIADTPEYFSFIEKTLGMGHRTATETQDESALSGAATATQQRRSSPAAAPVSRGGDTPTRVTLSAEEREMASMMGQTVQEYAKNKAALIKEGKLH